MGNPVVHFQIGAKNDQAAAEFYSKLFGWTATPVPNMPYQTIQTSSKIGIQGGVAKVENDTDAVITFYVEVPDVAAALEQAAALGGKVIQPAVQVMPTLTLGMFLDLEGRAVGLSTDTTTVAVPEVALAKPKPKPKAGKKAKKKAAKAKKKADKKAKKKKKKN
ncbi:MAG TPA: VOC family protein [bacterium]|nr:VOC family protein [bacterium]